MADPIGPGDLVECVLTGVGRHPTGFKRSAIYTCEGISTVPGRCECRRACGLGLFIKDMPNNYPFGWCANAFRPISRRSDFERFLTEVSKPRDDVTERTPETV